MPFFKTILDIRAYSEILMRLAVCVCAHACYASVLVQKHPQADRELHHCVDCRTARHICTAGSGRPSFFLALHSSVCCVCCLDLARTGRGKMLRGQDAVCPLENELLRRNENLNKN